MRCVCEIAPVKPAASAKGTVRPSDIPMTISRTVALAVKCCSESLAIRFRIQRDVSSQRKSMQRLICMLLDHRLKNACEITSDLSRLRNGNRWLKRGLQTQ